MSETVTITLADFNELKEMAATLRALEFGGVDSWTFYDDAIRDNLNECIEITNSQFTPIK